MTDDGKLGAFITEIRKGGPADRQAQLQIGMFSRLHFVQRESHPCYAETRVLLKNTPRDKFIGW